MCSFSDFLFCFQNLFFIGVLSVCTSMWGCWILETVVSCPLGARNWVNLGPLEKQSALLIRGHPSSPSSDMSRRNNLTAKFLLLWPFQSFLPCLGNDPWALGAGIVGVLVGTGLCHSAFDQLWVSVTVCHKKFSWSGMKITLIWA